MKILFTAFLCLCAPFAVAQNWSEPARGTADRAALMQAIRPLAEDVLGPKVQFVVRTLRVADDVGFALLSAQRPGGTPIDIEATPAFRRGDIDPQGGDPTALEVLYHKSDGGWVVADWGYASQEVWWANDHHCATWRSVTPGVCP